MFPVWRLRHAAAFCPFFSELVTSLCVGLHLALQDATREALGWRYVIDRDDYGMSLPRGSGAAAEAVVDIAEADVSHMPLCLGPFLRLWSPGLRLASFTDCSCFLPLSFDGLG